jgi:hypothetical protein
MNKYNKGCMYVLKDQFQHELNVSIMPSRNLNGNIKCNDMTIVWSKYKGHKEVMRNLD